VPHGGQRLCNRGSAKLHAEPFFCIVTLKWGAQLAAGNGFRKNDLNKSGRQHVFRSSYNDRLANTGSVETGTVRSSSMQRKTKINREQTTGRGLAVIGQPETQRSGGEGGGGQDKGDGTPAATTTTARKRAIKQAQTANRKAENAIYSWSRSANKLTCSSYITRLRSGSTAAANISSISSSVNGSPAM
jgi:hypothetical protein